MSRSAARQARRSALTLLGFAVAATALLSGVWTLTRDTVRANEDAARAQLLGQTLPPGSYDNALLQSRAPLPDAAAARLGVPTPAWAHIARRQGRISGYVLPVVAPNGYGGRIELLVGFGADGRVAGVRVVSHKETPGLGDYVTGDWARQFAGRGPDARWSVRKDGGDFDYVSGATVSARAVTGAVGRASAVMATLRPQLEGKQP